MKNNYSKKNKKANKELIKMLKSYLRQNASKFLNEKNISSVGIGLKQKNGKRTNEVCLQFSVNEKIELSTLESLNEFIIPETIEIDGQVITTDVIARKYELSFEVIEDVSDNSRKIRHDTIKPGISISNSKGSAGTLGCIVYDKDNNTPYILSNWHVLHGDRGNLRDTIVQPGPHDDNRTEFNVSGILRRSHLGEAGDCAICTIENRNFNEQILELNTNIQKLAEPELLDKVIKSGRTTGVTFGIIERVHVITQIHYGEHTGVKNIGCFEIGVDPENPPFDGEISKGGDSGSCWMICKNNKPTNIMAGLHFAGEAKNNPHEHALACYPKSVFEKLGIKPSDCNEEQVKTTGYNKNFLSTEINIPQLDDDRTAFKLDNSTCIDYTHFSLALHKKRKFAIWVAWNIDGGRIKRLSRKGINFKFDPRIPTKYQIGNNLYKNNDLDRGHIAKRADLVWGTIEEAKNANKESFYYTNITPQMDNFNQSTKDGVWGELENAIFKDVIVDNLKISIISGPIFQETDRVYREVMLPLEFYKLIIYESDGELKSKSFLLTQNINSIEVLALDEFKTYEISLFELESKCHFKLDPKLYPTQAEAQLETVEKRKPIKSTDQIKW